MTDDQKEIYNLYLSSVRKIQNKPFKYRKDFSNFEKQKEFIYIEKLESIFKQYPHLKKEEYFFAPFKIHGDANFYDLKYYSSYNGLKTSIAYINMLDQQSPIEQKELIKQSIKFIFNFCLEKNIQLIEYTSYKSVSYEDCLKHLKDHRISWFLVFDIPGFQKLLSDLSKDEFGLFFGENKNLGDYLVTLMKYPDERRYIQKALKFIEKKLATRLKR